MTATRQRDGLTGRSWLVFASKPAPELIAGLKANGWRWSGYRKAWHHPSREPRIPAGVELDGTIEDVDYAAERADRLEQRSEKAQANSDAAFARAKTIADVIPFGQPILVGHHSEKRHRRDLARIDSGMSKGFEEGRKADRLAAAAEASRKHQARMQSAPVIARRIKRIETEERDVLRKLDGRLEPSGGAGSLYVDGEPVKFVNVPPSPQYAARLNERLTAIRAELETNRAALAEAGGLPTDGVTFSVGDVIGCRFGPALVMRVNPSTVTVAELSPAILGYDSKRGRDEIKGVVAQATNETRELAMRCRKVRLHERAGLLRLAMDPGGSLRKLVEPKPANEAGI